MSVYFRYKWERKNRNYASHFLQTRLATRSIGKFNQYTITTNSVIKNKILIVYLETYPLFSSTFLNYLDWKEVVNKVEKKEPKD